MKWIRTHESRLHDLRFATLSAEAERAYNRMYILAGVLEADGLFIQDGRQLTPEEIAYRVRLDAATLKKTLNELQRARLVHVNGKGPQIVDFKTEQIDLRTRRAQINERVTRYRELHKDGNEVNRDETHLERETQTQTQTRVLLLLSADARSKVEKSHPEWPAQALEIANTKRTEDPVKYAAGVVRNWLLEGRASAPAKGKPVTGRKTSQKPKRKKLEGSALQAAREQAAKELLK